MNFVKTYGLWILLAAAVLVIFGVRLTYVSGLQQKEIEDCAQVLTAFDSTKAKRDDIAKGKTDAARAVPTAFDLKEVKAVEKRYGEQAKAVEKRWRELTDRLNWCMSNGKRETGEITDPLTVKTDEGGKVTDAGSPISWDLFAPRLRAFYAKTFDDMQETLKRRMEESLPEMLADEVYAASDECTAEEAAEKGAKDAPVEAENRSRIIADKAAIITVPVDAKYDENNKEEAWAEWRKYLLISDILERVVPNCQVELVRSLAARNNFDDSVARAECKKRRQNNEELLPLPLAEWDGRKDVRFIERIDDLKVSDPDPGTEVLDAVYDLSLNGKDKNQDKEKGRTQSNLGKAGGTAATRSARTTTFPRNRAGGAAGEVKTDDKRFYDLFSVTIEFDAHIEVVKAFQREILKSERIFYAPAEVEIVRIEDAKAMDGKMQSEGTVSGTTGGVSVSAASDLAPLRIGATFSHEPCVRAKLTYYVYRFRYADTDNPSAEQENAGGQH